MLQTLLQFGFTPAEAERIVSHAKIHEVRKGGCFLEPAAKARSLYFLESGLVRSYRLVDGEDFTYMFYFAGDFCVDFYAYLTGTPTQLYFDALVDSVLYEHRQEDIQKLYLEIPKLEKFGRLMAEKAFIIVSDRIKDMQAMEAKDRYLKLMAKSPEMLQQIQQKHIATYLNIKPESLSRIKAQIGGK